MFSRRILKAITALLAGITLFSSCADDTYKTSSTVVSSSSEISTSAVGLEVESPVDKIQGEVKNVDSQTHLNSSKDSNEKVDEDTSSKGLSENESQEMEPYVKIFAANFDKPFQVTTDLDQNSIGWFSFWRIYEENQLKVNTAGYCTISEKELSTYVLTRFGISDYKYTDITPAYDNKKDEYQFYPLGEDSLNDIQIVDTRYNDDNSIEYVINITTNPMSNEQPSSKVKKTIKYKFVIKSNNGSYYLQAVNALYWLDEL